MTGDDVADVLTIVEGTWRPLNEAQRAAWTRGLTGKDIDLTVATLDELIGQGGDHPPSWAGFAAAYAGKTRVARETAETDARVSAADMTRPATGDTTYAACCKAWLRRALSPASARWEWRDRLYGPEWPDTTAEFEPVMRAVAGLVDGLDPTVPVAERMATVIDGWDPATALPGPFARPQRAGKFHKDDWRREATVDGARFHRDGCRHWHLPAEPCTGPVTTRYEPKGTA